MGYNLKGIKNKKAEFDRGWMQVLQVCWQVNELEDLEIDFNGWNTNDGNGLKTQKECDKLADALDKYVDDIIIIEGLFIPKIFDKFSFNELEKDYSFHYEKKLVYEFIDFLRDCGGFKIK